MNSLMDFDDLTYIRETRPNISESSFCTHVETIDVGHYELGGFIALNILRVMSVYGTRRALRHEKTFENIDERQKSYLKCCIDCWRIYPLFFLVATFVNTFLFVEFCPYLADVISTVLFVAGRLYSFVALFYFTFFINSLIIPHSNWETWLPSHCLSRGVLLWVGFLSFTSLYAGETTSTKLMPYLMMSFTALGGFAYFRYKYDKHPFRVRLPEDRGERPADELVILAIAQFVFSCCGVHYQIAIYLSTWIDPDLTLAFPIPSLAFHAAMETYGRKVAHMPLVRNLCDSPEHFESSSSSHEEGSRRVILNLRSDLPYSVSYSAISDRAPLVSNEGM